MRNQFKSLPDPPKELVSRSEPWPFLCLYALDIDLLRNRPMDAWLLLDLSTRTSHPYRPPSVLRSSSHLNTDIYPAKGGLLEGLREL